ncbi:DUF3806 domain-containing protein [Motiliproteus sp. MSK22-1]|uniref:DUF3806 domain-containing protein n=1 Tax=Motiliproteus sp. MSK22-1 TaxID=1897630 RepID=UPI00097A933F|nr:DUF3806 domain-containing protein [Motiliproteus sp. MSK22-1]OMH38211.1 hypothetical protein BGP75_08130 [Motiliproteus sp. MSK22-1]
MQQMISLPNQDDINQLTKQLNFAELRISLIIEGSSFDGSLNDLDLIQQALDSGEIAATDTIDLQTLGVPFGQLFINYNPGFSWWMVDDNIGRAPCIRYRETDLLLYPLTLISKRIEDGEVVDVKQLFINLSQQLEEITSKLDLQESPSDN